VTQLTVLSRLSGVDRRAGKEEGGGGEPFVFGSHISSMRQQDKTVHTRGTLSDETGLQLVDIPLYCREIGYAHLIRGTEGRSNRATVLQQEMLIVKGTPAPNLGVKTGGGRRALGEGVRRQTRRKQKIQL